MSVVRCGVVSHRVQWKVEKGETGVCDEVCEVRFAMEVLWRRLDGEGRGEARDYTSGWGGKPVFHPGKVN